MSSKLTKRQLARLQQQQERQAYLIRLSYADTLERLAEQCDQCGDGEGAFPRCEKHNPI